ncbi:MAG: ABC transporter substrate-binding protein [Acetobacteraceae bacterium]|nr:ABC transporter substrate-binding protein [Acetobacteraceae bacterium]
MTAMAARPGLAAGEPFKIGVVASLTGGFAAATADEIAGVQAWAKARGVPGRTIAFETLDDETNPVNALNVFRRLAGDPAVPVIFALVNSNSAMAMKSVASEFKVPIVAGGSLGELGVPPDPWLFKVPPSPRDQIVVLCQYAQKKGYKRLASLHAQDGFGQAESKSVRELAPKAGLEIVEMESCGNDDTNVTPQITRIRAANPDIIYIGAVGRPGILALKTAQQMKITAPIAVQQAAVTKSLFDALGGPAAADGILTPSQIGAFGGAMGGDTARLYAELERAMGRKPVYLNTFGYDVGLITEAAVQDSDGSRAGIRDALERLKDLPALNGPVTFTAEDHTGQDYRSLAMAKLANGALVPAD